MHSTIIKILSKFVFFYLGFYLTYLLHHNFKINIVISSALIGLLGSFIPNRVSELFKLKISPLIYCGSFAGMCSVDILNGHQSLALISLIGAVIYYFLKERFVGMGGKLGMTAFMAVAIYFLFGLLI